MDKLAQDLSKFAAHFRREFDETEAYLRHRERVREREKREKLRKQGKLEAYLKEKEPPKPETVMEVEIEPQQPTAEMIMEEYKKSKKTEVENGVLENLSKFEVDEKKVEQVVKKIKLKKKHAKAKKARMEEDLRVEDSGEFKPRMAGKTGLPVFFFSNLVSQNKSQFVKHDARNRMSKPKFSASVGQHF